MSGLRTNVPFIAAHRIKIFFDASFALFLGGRSITRDTRWFRLSALATSGAHGHSAWQHLRTA
jgi:hypothetical protein